MAVIQQNAYGTIVTVLSTQLNSLANNAASAASASQGSDTGSAELWADFELVLASFTPGTNPVVELYLLRSVDGTNFEDAGGPPPDAYVGAFTITTGTGAKRAVLRDIWLPPGLWRAVVVNRTGAAFAASGNTLRMRPHSLSSV
jgi:hypothetical protein